MKWRSRQFNVPYSSACCRLSSPLQVTLLELTLVFYILLFLRDPPQLKVISRMPHGMTAWMAPFYKPQGEGVSITRYQPPGIKSTSILEEGISSRHNNQISPQITGKISNFLEVFWSNCDHAGLWIKGVWEWALAVFFDVFVNFGAWPFISTAAVMAEERKKFKTGFLFLESLNNWRNKIFFRLSFLPIFSP